MNAPTSTPRAWLTPGTFTVALIALTAAVAFAALAVAGHFDITFALSGAG